MTHIPSTSPIRSGIQRPVSVAVGTGSADRSRHRSRSDLRPADRIDWDPDLPGLGLRIQKGRESWVVQRRKDGKTIRRTLGSPPGMDREAARVAAREHHAVRTSPSLERFDLDLDPDATTFGDFLPVFLTHARNRWKPSTIANAERLGQRLCETFGLRAVASIGRTEVVTWFESLTGSTIWPLCLLSSALDHAEHLGLRASGSNPCRGLRRKKSRFAGRPLSPSDYAALGVALAAAKADHETTGVLAAIRFLALTGARRGEATDLRWDDLHQDRAVLPDSKTGPKTVWLCGPARDMLANLSRQPGATYVFRDADRARFLRKIEATWRELRQVANLGALRLHDLRHGFASVGIQMGMDLPTIGGLLGHADIGTTSGYAHLRSGHLADAVARVSDQIAGPLVPRPMSATRRRLLAEATKRTTRRPGSTFPAWADADVARYFTAIKAADRALSPREFCSEHRLDFDSFKTKLRDFRERRQAHGTHASAAGEVSP